MLGMYTFLYVVLPHKAAAGLTHLYSKLNGKTSFPSTCKEEIIMETYSFHFHSADLFLYWYFSKSITIA